MGSGHIVIVLIIISLSLITIPVFAQSDFDFRYQHKETWERLGELHPTQLRGIVIDSNDDLYVIDSNKLTKLTTDNELLWSIKIQASGELYLNQNDEIIVPFSHKEVNELRKYSQSGELVKTWNLNDFEISTDKSTYVQYVDTNENIYVLEWVPNYSDSTNIIGTLKKFDSSENLLKTYENMGLLKLIDDKGNLYTTEPGKIVKYGPNGNKIIEYGKQKFRGGVGTFAQHAETIIIDANGIIFATGGAYGPINIIDEEGNFSGISGYGLLEGTYGHPRGIALDSENNAYVTDYSRNKILVYEKIPLEKSLQDESEQIVCPQGFEPDPDGRCPDKPVVESTINPRDLGIASFVDSSKEPQHYVDRYNNEPSYRKWFHDNYPEYDSIEQAVGLELTRKIPDWVKNIFVWYGQDQVSEDELLNAIKYLINEKILVVD